VLEGADFLEAVTGHPVAREAADVTIRERLRKGVDTSSERADPVRRRHTVHLTVVLKPEPDRRPTEQRRCRVGYRERSRGYPRAASG
jgi:hypothetical protein